MCGRYASTISSVDLSALFGAQDETDEELTGSFNVAPTDPIAVVRHSSRTGERVLSVARWGLVPPWAKDRSGAARMINARAETVATSRAFAQAYERRRCLIPADGWYEWIKLDAKRKQPYFMTDPAGGPLVFAGIWSVWADRRDDDAERLLTASILTTAATGDLARVHDRMPVLLPEDRWADWLGADDPAALLAPPAQYLQKLEIRPVGAAVGDVRNNSPELVTRVPDPAHAALPRSTVEHANPPLF